MLSTGKELGLLQKCFAAADGGWHRTLQGQGGLHPPRAPHPLTGCKDPQAAPSPPCQTLVAMLGLVSPSWWQQELVLLWWAQTHQCPPGNRSPAEDEPRSPSPCAQAPCRVGRVTPAACKEEK